MSRTIDKSVVLERLAEAAQRDPSSKVFGALGHHYKLNPTLAVSLVEAFEKHHGVSLPVDYRRFITEIGNGGAGPYYGVLPFGKDDDDRDWKDGGLVGDLSKPFPHLTAWNQAESFWEDAPNPRPDTPLEEEDKLWEAWDKVMEEHYWNPSIMNGAILICHKGCALRQWLVINSEQRGFVWNDHRADNRGIAPVLDQTGNPNRFADWYMEWLDSLP
jgi:hypothetical protein